MIKLEKGKTYIIEIGWEATVIGTLKREGRTQLHLYNVQVDRGLSKPVYHKFYNIDKSVITNIKEW